MSMDVVFISVLVMWGLDARFETGPSKTDAGALGFLTLLGGVELLSEVCMEISRQSSNANKCCTAMWRCATRSTFAVFEWSLIVYQVCLLISFATYCELREDMGFDTNEKRREILNHH